MLERGHSFPKDSQRARSCRQAEKSWGLSFPDKTDSSGVGEGRGLFLPTWGWKRAGPEMEEVSTPLMGKEGKERQ